MGGFRLTREKGTHFAGSRGYEFHGIFLGVAGYRGISGY